MRPAVRMYAGASGSPYGISATLDGYEALFLVETIHKIREELAKRETSERQRFAHYTNRQAEQLREPRLPGSDHVQKVEVVKPIPATIEKKKSWWIVVVLAVLAIIWAAVSDTAKDSLSQLFHWSVHRLTGK
jgi:hypothetical protein